MCCNAGRERRIDTMIKVKLVNCMQGIGKDSGKPYCRVTLASDRTDGTRAISDFWCNQTIANKVATIPLDSYVYVSAELDDALHFNISDIRTAETTKA